MAMAGARALDRRSTCSCVLVWRPTATSDISVYRAEGRGPPRRARSLRPARRASTGWAPTRRSRRRCSCRCCWCSGAVGGVAVARRSISGSWSRAAYLSVAGSPERGRPPRGRAAARRRRAVVRAGHAQQRLYGQINLLILCLVLWDFYAAGGLALARGRDRAGGRDEGDPGHLHRLPARDAALPGGASALSATLLVDARSSRAALDAVVDVGLLDAPPLRPHPGGAAGELGQPVRARLARPGHHTHRHPPARVAMVARPWSSSSGWPAAASTATAASGDAWGLLVAALTGLLVSPISWSHHWVWCVPLLALALVRGARLGAPDPRSSSGHYAVRLVPARRPRRAAASARADIALSGLVRRLRRRVRPRRFGLAPPNQVLVRARRGPAPVATGATGADVPHGCGSPTARPSPIVAASCGPRPRTATETAIRLRRCRRTSTAPQRPRRRAPSRRRRAASGRPDHRARAVDAKHKSPVARPSVTSELVLDGRPRRAPTPRPSSRSCPRAPTQARPGLRLTRRRTGSRGAPWVGRALVVRRRPAARRAHPVRQTDAAFRLTAAEARRHEPRARQGPAARAGAAAVARDAGTPLPVAVSRSTPARWLPPWPPEFHVRPWVRPRGAKLDRGETGPGRDHDFREAAASSAC